MEICSRWILLALSGLVCLFGVGSGATLRNMEAADDSVVSVPFEVLLINASMNSDLAVFHYNEHNHLVRTEYDMLFSLEELEEIRSLGRQKRTAGIRPNKVEKRWTKNTVNYEIAPNTFSGSDMKQISKSFDEWSHFTCLKFKKSYSGNRINIYSDDGCFSRVGMVGTPGQESQPLSLGNGCRYTRIIVHELGHAIGLHHEQTRPDRDQYVTIVKDNIRDDMEYNFELYDWKYIQDFSIPYDYLSIMHYSKTAFSMNGKVTIATKDSDYQDVIGMQGGLSFRDIKTVNAMYSCKPNTCDKKDEDCPGEGFVGKDCTCWCPGSPAQYCSQKDRDEKGDLSTIKTTTVIVTNDCIDTSSSCSTLAFFGQCSQSPSYMRENCKKTCGFC